MSQWSTQMGKSWSTCIVNLECVFSFTRFWYLIILNDRNLLMLILVLQLNALTQGTLTFTEVFSWIFSGRCGGVIVGALHSRSSGLGVWTLARELHCVLGQEILLSEPLIAQVKMGTSQFNARHRLVCWTLDSGPWPGNCVVFLGMILYSHSASLHLGV